MKLKHWNTCLAAAACAVALALPVAVQASPWFDLDNCSMCKNMTAEEGLMEHMEWENHLIESGMLSVTLVDPSYAAAFERAMTNMHATGEKLMTGEQMYLCGYCQGYGTLMMAGATWEKVDTEAGHISLVTSTDPVVVAQIREFGQRTIDEYATMMAASHGEHPHDTHEHPGDKH